MRGVGDFADNSRCSAYVFYRCHRSIELHDKRHREIGGLRNALLQLSGKYANDPLTAVELEKIHNAVHGSPCRGNTTNLVKTKSADSSKFDAKQKKTASKNGNSRSSCIPVEDDARIPAIIRRLGISDGDVSPDNKNKKFHSVLTQLRHAIALDLVSVENEEREIMMRMAGYWRYVNRRTYNAMVRNNQLWDWATGEKLDELDVSGSDDGDDDPNEGQDDERADNGPRKRGKKGKSGSGGRRR